jgi:hypothetical protein
VGHAPHVRRGVRNASNDLHDSGLSLNVKIGWEVRVPSILTAPFPEILAALS